jgi:serine/threonine-protein kinase HipA
MREPSRIVFCWVDGRFVPCGLLERLNGENVPAHRSSRFIYAKSWLSRKDAFPIDPERLPLISTWQHPPENYQLHGVFRDATPDGWGQQIIDKRFAGQKLGDIEYLAAAGDERAGMLGIGVDPKGAPGCVTPHGKVLDAEPPMPLKDLQEAAHLLDKGEDIPARLQACLNRGGSPGGARPKASFRDDNGELWISKFTMQGDSHDEPRVEGATLTMAAACGITVPVHQILTIADHSVLLVRRFDRPIIDGTEQRLGYLSLQTLLDADPTKFYSDKSYADIAAAIRKIGRPAGEEIFRRMAFNALIGNSDDHLRNHAAVRSMKGEWQLSPAFDMVPQPQSDGKHVVKFATSYQASIGEVMDAAAQLAVPKGEAHDIMKRVVAVTRDWRKFMKDAGVSQKDIATLSPAFALVEQDAAHPF